MTKKQTDGKVVLSRGTPGKSAGIFRDRVRPNLINQQDEWLDWNQHAYVSVEDATINSELERFAREAFTAVLTKVGEDADKNPIYEKRFVPFDPQPRDLYSIYDMLKRQNHKPSDTMSPPCWLSPYETPKPRNVISVENGLFDIESGNLYAATPEFFTRTSLPIVYDADALAPTLWLQFLDEVFDGHSELVNLLQEIFGYIVSGDASQQAVFFLWGRPRSGKGTILRVITELVGKLNCHNPSIATLAGRFGLEGCIAKSLIKVTDANCDNKAFLSEACSKINAISGEDDVTIERKTILDWNGRLPGRFILAGNRLPNFGGGSIALATRLMILPFVVSFLGREDRTLTDKLLVELPGILNWALAGLAKLRERGRFAEPAISQEAKTRMLYQSDPVRGFIEDRCEVEAGAAIEKQIFYPLYREFCEANGSRIIPLPALTEQLSEIYPSISASKRRKHDGSRPPIFSGVRLNDAAMTKVFKPDAGLYAIGLEGVEAIEHDSDGWPVPKSGNPFYED